MGLDKIIPRLRMDELTTGRVTGAGASSRSGLSANMKRSGGSGSSVQISESALSIPNCLRASRDVALDVVPLASPGLVAELSSSLRALFP